MRALLLFVYCPLLLAQASHALAELVVLGSGTPGADPDRSGPAVAVIVNGHSYLVDCGPGVVRRAAAASRAGVPGLAATDLNTVFITHLHSDHTLGYPDLIFSPWVAARRSEHLSAYGPRGLQEMTDHILAAWKKDIDVRTNGLEHNNRTGYLVDVHEIQPGIVYKDANVIVKAFLVKHGSWEEAFGYRFEVPGRTIVISGDTAPTEAIIKACNGCDVLLHEVYAPFTTGPHLAERKAYFDAFHTSTEELATIASRAKPKLLVLYHQLFIGVPEGELLQSVREHYAGAVVSAHDLDVY
jgi:ribonuclease BN (tRNA processing enzyme)